MFGRLFGKKPVPERTLAGEVLIENLPEHIGVMINLALLPVASANSPVPYDGNPPGDAGLDLHPVINEMEGLENLKSVRPAASRRFLYELRRPQGHYYIQVRVIAFRMIDSQFSAQVENFFFSRRTVALVEDIFALDFPVSWPSLSPDELHSYGTIHPDGQVERAAEEH